MIYKAVRGTKDILPDDTGKWQYIIKIARETFDRYGYSEIIIPTFESTELFTRGIGGTTDIVTKEMYSFTDKKGRSITLRPEGTAGVIRAYLENGLCTKSSLIKLYYIGPMFRYERPQSGRYREHWQIGVEAIGSDNPALDGEVINYVIDLLKKLGITDLKTQLNSIGCLECRPKYIHILKEFLKGKISGLCEVCVERIEKNPLRILDCKGETCKSIFKDKEAPKVLDFLCEPCNVHFNLVKEYLELLHIKYEINNYLVRGFDYYTKTVFEIVSDKLGAQNSIVGGGRYNNLVEELGGSPTPAVGFALGIERLLLSLDSLGVNIPCEHKLDIFIVYLGKEALKKSLEISSILRNAGYKVISVFEDKSLKSQLKIANQYNAEKVIIVGDNELKQGIVILKNMKDGSQKNIKIENILEGVKSI
ncbi:MAG: histidine--tRNA ligase [Candidatus Firestonebacteria bacterium]